MNSKKIILISIMILIALPMFVQANILDDLQNTADGLSSMVNTTFDYIVRFIQWIFILAINIYFILIFLIFWAILFLSIWIPTLIEPYITKLQALSEKLLNWFRGAQ